MTLTETRNLVEQVDHHVAGAQLAAESAMENTEIGDARLNHATAAHYVVLAQGVAEAAKKAALEAIQAGARGGTLCSSKEEWDIALYTARAATEAELHMYVAGEAVQSLCEGESYFKS